MTGLLLRGTWYYSRVPRTGLEPATLCLEGRCSPVYNTPYASIYVAETVIIRSNYGNIIQEP